MNETQKLVELIRKARQNLKDEKLNSDLSREFFIAEYLLANGVIVAPMPMAEWLRQELTEYVYKRCMEEL